MLSYKNWKSLNESFFNQTLGLSNHQNLGLVSPSSLFDPVHSEAKAKKEVIEDESGDGETVPAASEKDDPKMGKCKYCGKYSKKMKKEDIDHEYEESMEDHEGDEDHEDYEGDEDHEDHEGDEDHEDYEGDEDHDESDEDHESDEYHDESDEDEFEESKKHKKHMKHMKCMKCMKESSYNESKKSTHKKKSKKSVPKKDVDSDTDSDVEASEDSEAAIISKLVKKGLPEKLAIAVAKKKMKKIKNESSWMEGVFGANPTRKFYDGIS